MTLAKTIDTFLNDLMATSSHQNEVLLGPCQSKLRLTGTQEHILMLLENGDLTNRDLSKQLSVSQAGVSKAVKQLVKLGLINAERSEHDGRASNLFLSETGRPIAKEHREHHEKTINIYDAILEDFTASEQDTILRFVTALKNEVL